MENRLANLAKMQVYTLFCFYEELVNDGFSEFERQDGPHLKVLSEVHSTQFNVWHTIH